MVKRHPRTSNKITPNFKPRIPTYCNFTLQIPSVLFHFLSYIGWWCRDQTPSPSTATTFSPNHLVFALLSLENLSHHNPRFLDVDHRAVSLIFSQPHHTTFIRIKLRQQNRLSTLLYLSICTRLPPPVMLFHRHAQHVSRHCINLCRFSIHFISSSLTRSILLFFYSFSLRCSLVPHILSLRHSLSHITTLIFDSILSHDYALWSFSVHITRPIHIIKYTHRCLHMLILLSIRTWIVINLTQGSFSYWRSRTSGSTV